MPSVWKLGARRALVAALMAGAAGAASAATTPCGSGATVTLAEIETVAICRSFGSLGQGESPPDRQDWGVSSTVDGGSGSLSLTTYAGFAVTPLIADDPIPRNFIQYDSGIDPAQYYLALIYETGLSSDDWMLVNLLGADIIGGVDYVESFSQGVAKVELYVDPTNGNPGSGGGGGTVPVPGTLALAALGLAGLGWTGRRTGMKPAA